MRAFKCGTIGLTVLLVGFVSFASAGTRRDDREDQAYLDLGNLFPSVGYIEGSTPSYGFTASGVLIDSNWVLTAGHVVDEATSLDFTIGGATYSAANWKPHPKWRGDLWAGYDIGLINLDVAVPDVAPAERYKRRKELGAEATIVGYGMTGTGETGATTFDGKKRGGENVIDVLYGTSRKKQNLLLCDFDNPDETSGDNVYGSATPLDLEFLIAPGDSGGGLFLDIGGTPLLAGVNSFIGWFDEAGDSDYGDISGHTRVSAFNKWIDQVISGDGNGGGGGHGGGKPPWAGGPKKGLGTTPEPATLSLLAFGALLLLRRRR